MDLLREALETSATLFIDATYDFVKTRDGDRRQVYMIIVATGANRGRAVGFVIPKVNNAESLSLGFRAFRELCLEKGLNLTGKVDYFVSDAEPAGTPRFQFL